MKISKKDALMWFEFFAELPEKEELMSWQMEIAYAVFAQIEDALEEHRAKLAAEIPGLQSLEDRTYYVGDVHKFPQGCRSCLFGAGLNANRKTNQCNLSCKFCYNCGELKDQTPIGEDMWEIKGTKFHEAGIHQFLYTNGTLAGEDSLRKLGEPGRMICALTWARQTARMR